MSRAPIIDAGFGGGAPIGEPEQRDPEIPARLIYGWDALCGWCFGIIPAMRHLVSVLPDLPVVVMPGGLVQGDKVRPYADDLDYIRGAAPKMEAVTGRKLGAAFWEMIETRNPVANSAPPSLALLRMQAANPTVALDFAHQLQEAHFVDGADLNDPETYDDLIERFALPEIRTDDLVEATEDTPEVAAAYAEARAREIGSFPTLIVEVLGQETGRITSTYDPAELEAQVKALLP